MNDWTFDRDAIRVFRFVRCEFDAQTGIAQFRLRLRRRPGLVETVVVPGAPFEPGRCARRRGRTRAAAAAPRRRRQLLQGRGAAGDPHRRLRHRRRDRRAAGKPVPARAGRIRVSQRARSARAHRFPFSPPLRERCPKGGRGAENIGLREHPSRGRALVAIGGGKGFAGQHRGAARPGVEQTVAWIGGSQLIAACAARTGLPTLNIGRRSRRSCSNTTARARGTATSR